METESSPSNAETASHDGSRSEWSDISISDTAPLPKVPKNAAFDNPKFMAQSFHSQVYSVDVTIKGERKRAILKLFPKELQNRYTMETDAYRFLNHYDLASRGIVPKFYGDLPSIKKPLLLKILKDSIPDDVQIALPASGILIEYIEGGETPSSENMTVPIARAILDGLDYIHGARILHGDCNPRNIFVFPQTVRIVWFDFSHSMITRLEGLFETERGAIKSELFLDFVCSRLMSLVLI
jgi:hypothetical protein